MRVLGRSGLRAVSLSPSFRGGVWAVKYRWNRCSSIFAFETSSKFKILLPRGLLVDNNAFSKMRVFKKSY